jgi:small conductance mechanosensitive channel
MPTPMFSILLSGLLAILTTSPEDVVSDAVGIPWDEIDDYLLGKLADATQSIIQIILIVIIALIILRLLRSVVQGVVQRVLSAQDQPPRALQQRAETLADVVESAGRYVVIIIATMMILTNLGLQIGPLIASAGLAGLALGLGAQSLVKDTINGFFILFENQLAVGDVVKLGDVSGSVEEVSLRRTVLRAVNGAQIIVPNGEIRVVQNMSKGWSRAIIDIETAPTANDAEVVALLHEILTDIQKDPKIGHHILEPPEILGINSINVTGVTFRVLVKTEPMQQWGVERALRLHIREAFRDHGIPLPVVTSATVAPGTVKT